MFAFQFWSGELGALGKFSIELRSVSLYWPFAVSCGRATARVCTTTPCWASRSLLALRMVPFCWRAILRQSVSDSGRVIQAGTLGLALVFWARAVPPIQPAIKKVSTIFFMGKNALTAAMDRRRRPRFRCFRFGHVFHGGKRETCDVIRQWLDSRGVQPLFGKQPCHHPPAMMIEY